MPYSETTYEVDVEITIDGLKDIYKLLVIFRKDDGMQSFGNKTSMYVKSRNNRPFESFYDVRYDKRYDEREQMTYIVRWAERMWNGNMHRVTSICIKKL